MRYPTIQSDKALRGGARTLQIEITDMIFVFCEPVKSYISNCPTHGPPHTHAPLPRTAPPTRGPPLPTAMRFAGLSTVVQVRSNHSSRPRGMCKLPRRSCRTRSLIAIMPRCRRSHRAQAMNHPKLRNWSQRSDAHTGTRSGSLECANHYGSILTQAAESAEHGQWATGSMP